MAKTVVVSVDEARKLLQIQKKSKEPVNKFRNIPVVINGIKFQSTLEGKRYSQLCMMLKAGIVTSFRRQVKYSIDIGDIHICDYIADFVTVYPSGREDIEDTKGVITPEFRIKKKLMLAVLGLDIKLIFDKSNKPVKKSVKKKR